MVYITASSPILSLLLEEIWPHFLIFIFLPNQHQLLCAYAKQLSDIGVAPRLLNSILMSCGFMNTPTTENKEEALTFKLMTHIR